MANQPSFLSVVKQSRGVLVLLVLAVGIGSWSAIQYARSAPIQTHIDEGVRLQSEGKNQEAEREWQEAVHLDPNNSQAWELLGDLYLKEHSFPAAKNAFDNVSRLAPNTPDLKARMAIAAYQLHDNDAARQLAQEELKTNRDSIAALQILVKVEKDTHSDELLAALKHLVELQPQNIQALNDLTDELHNRDAYDQIIPLTDRLVKLAPRSADSYLRRAIALYIANPSTGSITRAKNDLQKALQLDPQNVEAHRYLGRVYLRQNQPRLAITEFEAVGKGRPYASAHLMELSQAYRRAGDIKRADELRARFTSLRELNTRWLNLSEQIARTPNNGSYYLQMASLLVQHAFGNDPDAYYLYSFQAARGKILSVQEYLDAASRLNPKPRGIRAIQQQVEVVYNHYIQAGEKAVRARNYAQANENAARALLLRPRAERTVRLVQQVKIAGFDPTPRFSPEAVQTEHDR